MATQVQIRRGSAAQIAAFTGAAGEVVYATDTHRLYTNDGSTLGGFAHLKQDSDTATNLVHASGSISSPVTGVTQALSDSSTKLATTAFVKGQPAPRTGGTVTNPMSANIVLTASSNQLQAVYPNAGGLALQLPDATTFTLAGGAMFVAVNHGLVPVEWIDSASNLIGWVKPGQISFANLESISTATGPWRISSGDMPTDNGFAFWGPSQAGSVAQSSPYVCQLDYQFGILFYSDGSNYKGAGYKIIDGQLEFGASATVTATGLGGGVFDAQRLSATELIYALSPTAATSIVVGTIDINTATLAITVNATANVVTAVTITSADGVCLDVISASLALLLYGDGTNTKTVTVSVSAGTCTVNTPASVQAVRSGSQPKVIVLSATLAHCLYGNGTINYARIVLSSTTVTPGTPTAISSRKTTLGLSKQSATVSLALYTGTESTTPSLYANVLTDSGSISAVETALIAGVASSDPVNGAIVRLGAVQNANGSLGLLTRGGNGGQALFNLVRVVSGTPVLFPTVNMPAINGMDTTPGVRNALGKSFSNTMLMAYQALDGATEVTITQPCAMA